MMRIKGKVIAATVVTLMSFALCACHGSKGGSDFEIPEQFDSSKNIEISFWAKNDTNKAQTEVYKNAISEFQKLYPNITVNLKLYTDYSKIYNDVITNISTNTTPNVCITYPDHIATYMTGGNTVVPLDSLLDDEKYGLGGSEVLFASPSRDQIIERFLNEGILGDHYYALPYMRSTEALYINRDMVEKLGYEVPDIVTWDFVWEVSEEAMKQDASGKYIVNGDEVLIPFIYKSTDNMMITMLKQLDAGYSTDSGEIQIFNDDTRAVLKEIAPHARSGAFSTFKISSYPGNFMNAGQCIFAVDSTAGSTWMGADAPLSDIHTDDKVVFNMEVRPVPQYDTDNIWMMSQGPSICVFNKSDSQEVLASWLFAQFLLTDDVQVGYAQTEGYVPVTTSARETDEYQDYIASSGKDNNLHYKGKIDATELLLSNTEHTFVTPVFNGSASLRQAAGALIEDVTKSERRKKSVSDELIDKEFDDVTSLYRLDQIQTDMSGGDLGKLPTASRALIIVLIITWILIGIYYVSTTRKKS